MYKSSSSGLLLIFHALCLSWSAVFVFEAVGLYKQEWHFAQVRVLHIPSRWSLGTSADQAGISLRQRSLPVKLPASLPAGADARGISSAYGDRSSAWTCRNQHGEWARPASLETADTSRQTVHWEAGTEQPVWLAGGGVVWPLATTELERAVINTANRKGSDSRG